MKKAEVHSSRGIAGKLMRSLVIVAPAAVALYTAFGTMFVAGPRAEAASVLSCSNLDWIQRVFLSQHINYKAPTETLEAHAVEQYVKRLDPAKIYLLESDVQDAKDKLKGLFGKLKKTDCSALDSVQSLFATRVQERADYALRTLWDDEWDRDASKAELVREWGASAKVKKGEKKWKFDPKTELLLDPEKRKHPKTKAEADAFQAKYLQFQISNYLATGMAQDEARWQVVRNYERIAKRVKETSKEDLYSGYLDSFGRALDPHSSYFSRDMLEDFEISMGLSLEGIGATLSSQDGFTVVEQLIDGGSAKASGMIVPQDKIVAVGQFKSSSEPSEMENVVELDLRDVVRKIRGPKGSKVRLMILRKATDGKTERFTVDLVRDKIKLEEEAAAVSYQEREVNGQKKKIAVVNLPSFYADAKRGGRSCATDVKKLLKEVKDKRADALVLDLSGNGGGSLDDAVKIAGLFFKTGNVVKQSSGDPSQPEATLADTDPTVDWEGPMVVLTSRISASASEIVSGTLKDYRRAVIVGGDHTFGKGSVQSVVPLPPGLGAVKVTVGMFFTPGGFSTQHRGVEADVVLPGAFSNDEIGERSLDYSLPPKQIKPFLSPEAHVAQGPDAWLRVEPALLAQLKSRSQARVAKNADFQKILVELKKAKEKSKVVKLSESQKDTKEKKDEADQKKNLSKDEKMAEYAKRAEVLEAVSVAADLLALQNGIILTDADNATKPAEKASTQKKTR